MSVNLFYNYDKSLSYKSYLINIKYDLEENVKYLTYKIIHNDKPTIITKKFEIAEYDKEYMEKNNSIMSYHNIFS